MNISNQHRPSTPTLLARLGAALKAIPAWFYPLALLLLVPLLLPGYFATPVVFESCAVRQALVLHGSEPFTVDHFEGQGDFSHDVAAGEKYCMDNLHLSGQALNTDDNTRVRLFNVGDKGEFYLHEPPLNIVSGHWKTDRVRPGSNIREIRFVRMTEASSRMFSAMAGDGIWQTVALPRDAVSLASIPVEPVPVCAQLDARNCVR